MTFQEYQESRKSRLFLDWLGKTYPSLSPEERRGKIEAHLTRQRRIRMHQQSLRDLRYCSFPEPPVIIPEPTVKPPLPRPQPAIEVHKPKDAPQITKYF